MGSSEDLCDGEGQLDGCLIDPKDLPLAVIEGYPADL